MTQSIAHHQLERAANWLLLLLVVITFGVSAMLLSTMGIKYDEPGGSFLQKLHPASWCAALALGVKILSFRHRSNYIVGLPIRFPGAACFTLGWLLLILFAVVVQHAPITTLVDTFFCSVVFLILFTDADETTRRQIRLIVHGMLFANACIGISEFITHLRLTPFVTGGKIILHDYRSTAILGHPLVNSATTAGYALMLFLGADRTIPWLLRCFLIGVQLVALVAFGGRSAIVFCVVLGAIGFLRPAADLLVGKRFDMRMALFSMLALPLVFGAAAAAASGGYLDNIVERFVDDKGSAYARVVMLQLFDSFSMEELLLGPDPARLDSLMNLLGIEYGIENSWVAFIFMYGGLMSALFVTGFVFLLWDLWRRTGPGATLLMIYLLAQLSSAAGISVKSFLLNQFVIMLLAIVGGARRDQFSEPRPAGAFSALHRPSRAQ